MPESVIRISGLGKRYRIGQREQYQTLRDRLTRPFERRRSASPSDSIWALRDVSFEVQQGEVLGVIGANGAGKSTLLKILARITEPTMGQVELQGRVGSLLEVGTGFHPELTGRENIFLNGAILGMRRSEIHRRFDEMVAFSGVEKFLETPVKHYSSGMYTRLAFSVAVHLLAEVLLVDEVLAVGDAAFQLQCFNKMSEISGSGRTILFVSHNMEAVTTLCSRCVLLVDGQVARIGTPQECIEQYLQDLRQRQVARNVISLVQHPGRTKKHNGPVQFTRMAFLDEEGEPTTHVSCGGPLTVVMDFELMAGAPPQDIVFIVTFANMYGHRIGSCRSHDASTETIHVDRSGRVSCHIPRLPLVPGLYKLTLSCSSEAGPSDGIYDAAVIEVVGSGFYTTGRVPRQSSGDVLFDHQWEHAVGDHGVSATSVEEPASGRAS